ncbi:MAG TPA: phosphoribosyltransferase family protein [Mycobacteriales bacterium]|nr:phosphoribosyltransferase family protein [Mycobacteriales bacterium]
MFGAVAQLVLPSCCVSCGAAGAALCPPCGAPLRGPAARQVPSPRPAGLPPVWATATYDGAVRTALISYKERNRRDLTAPLAAGLGLAVWSALAGGAGRAGSAIGAAGAAETVGTAGGGSGGEVVLVPIPSGRPVARRRGGDHVRRLAAAALPQLATAAARGLTQPAVLCPALRPTPATVDAAALSAADRRVARAGAFVVHRACSAWLATRPPGSVVVIVDDLITTGATVAEAATVLHMAGVRVAAAAVVAATQRNR